jgi:hypothetical protein
MRAVESAIRSAHSSTRLHSFDLSPRSLLIRMYYCFLNGIRIECAVSLMTCAVELDWPGIHAAGMHFLRPHLVLLPRRCLVADGGRSEHRRCCREGGRRRYCCYGRLGPGRWTAVPVREEKQIKDGPYFGS